jgi:hypothetical protein
MHRRPPDKSLWPSWLHQDPSVARDALVERLALRHEKDFIVQQDNEATFEVSSHHGWHRASRV